MELPYWLSCLLSLETAQTQSPIFHVFPPPKCVAFTSSSLFSLLPFSIFLSVSPLPPNVSSQESYSSWDATMKPCVYSPLENK